MPLLTVAPLADGWRLSVDQIANDMVFRSGRAAELAARRLALQLSRAGIPAEVRVNLRANSTAARFVWAAARESPESVESPLRIGGSGSA